MPELRAEGYSRMTCELEKQGAPVKLTIVHEMDEPGSKFIESVSAGWPPILSSLKSLLETRDSAGSHPPLGGLRITGVRQRKIPAII